MRETRAGKLGELRFNEEDGRHYFTARICNYGVPDSFGTSWQFGVFEESLRRKLPTAVFAHQWDRPIGKAVSYQDNPDGLDVTVRMSDLSVNPDALRMYHHLKDQEIEEFSFAFERREQEPDENHRGVTRIVRADLDEISPVLKGSVPGTRILSLRTGGSVSREAAADILVKFSQGEYDLADALTQLKTGGTGEGAPPIEVPEDFPQPGDEEDKPGEEIPVQPEPDEDEQAILGKLATMARRK